MSTRIRPATPTDRASTVSLWLELIEHHRRLDPEYPAVSGMREVLLKEIDRALRSASCRLLLAESAEDSLPRARRVVGFLFAEVEPGGRSPAASSPVRTGWIHELYVEPGFRRRGVARALVEEAQAFFAERASARTSVRVESGNAEGRAFWRRVGFTEKAVVLEKTRR